MAFLRHGGNDRNRLTSPPPEFATRQPVHQGSGRPLVIASKAYTVALKRSSKSARPGSDYPLNCHLRTAQQSSRYHLSRAIAERVQPLRRDLPCHVSNRT